MTDLTLRLSGLMLLLVAAGDTAGASPSVTAVQEPPAEVADPGDYTDPAGTVLVDPTVGDAEIRLRLEAILGATEWFDALEVEVTEGVVVIEGTASSADHRDWATTLASQIEGVVGVANRMDVELPIDWDLSPAWGAVRDLSREAIRRLPLMLVGMLLIAVSVLVGRVVARVTRPLMERRIDNGLLRQVAGTLITISFMLVGVYLFLHVAGLSRLAATVLGGTGLFGLIVGIAFRDIAENFLASVLISAKRPFRLGDQIGIGDLEGFVQSVTTRGTLLVTVDGNHVHIPNSTIYKSTIINYTANPERRFEFIIGVDYADSVEQAQAICLRVLEGHDQVLDDPSPLVLVSELGGSSVNLRVQFWVNTTRSKASKVRSSILRQTKATILEAGLTMPDDAREIIFPQGVPVHQLDSAPPRPAAPEGREHLVTETTSAEGGAETEAETVQRQARGAAVLDMGESLLED